RHSLMVLPQAFCDLRLGRPLRPREPAPPRIVRARLVAAACCWPRVGARTRRSFMDEYERTTHQIRTEEVIPAQPVVPVVEQPVVVQQPVVERPVVQQPVMAASPVISDRVVTEREYVDTQPTGLEMAR